MNDFTYKMWDKITYPFKNFIDAAIEVQLLKFGTG